MKNAVGVVLKSFFILIASFLIFGCSAGFNGASPDGESTGSYSISVDWPQDSAGDTESNVKLIPTGTNKIAISITGNGMTSDILTTIIYPQTSITIDELPAGNKVATIIALDASNNIKAQRKDSFAIKSAQTTTSDSIPLGIAITGSSTNPVFEPSSINSNGTTVYVQNWLPSQKVCRVRKNGTDTDNALNGIAADLNGKTIISQTSYVPQNHVLMTVPGYANAKAESINGVCTVKIAPSYVGSYLGNSNATNGLYGATSQVRRTNGAYENLTWTTDWGGRYCYPTETTYRCPQVMPGYNTFSYDAAGTACSLVADGVVKLKLTTIGGASSGTIRITGTAYNFATRTQDHCYLRIYKGAGNYASYIREWHLYYGQSASVDETFTFNNNEELFFVCRPGGAGCNYGQWQNLKIEYIN